MPGNRTGGIKAAQKNKKLYGADYYARIGQKGGRLGHTGGFAEAKKCQDSLCQFPHGEHFVRQCAGFKGGRISRRRPAKWA